MERVTVEQNGERFTLEVPDGTSDDQIRAFVEQQQSNKPAAAITPQNQTANRLVEAGLSAVNAPAIGEALSYPFELGQQVAEAVPPPIPQAAMAAARTTLPTAVDVMAQGPVAQAAKTIYNRATPQMAATMMAHPIEAAQTVVKNLGGMFPQATLKDVVTKTPGMLAQGAGAVARGFGTALTAPENLMTLPYNLAAYEQEKIRANPQAPGLEYNPYAQQVRGEYPTQGAAAAANRQRAIAGQQYGGVTPEERAILDQDRLNMAIRLKAAKKVLGQP